MFQSYNDQDIAIRDRAIEHALHATFNDNEGRTRPISYHDVIAFAAEIADFLKGDAA